MSGIGAVPKATAVCLVRPVGASGSAGGFRQGDRSAPRSAGTASASTGDSGRTSRPTGAYAPFVAQAIANDNLNPIAVSQAQGTIAYIVARDRGTDLPVGFLIARAV